MKIFALKWAVTMILMAWAVLFGGISTARAEPPMTHGFCPPSQVQSGLLCVSECPKNHRMVGGVCWPDCPAGFTDIGAFCTNLDIRAKVSYGRGAGLPMWCRPGTEQNGLLCYPTCKAGYHGVGPVCWEQCPAGTDLDVGPTCTRTPRIIRWEGWFIFRYPVMDWGWVHWKKSYGRGVGEALSHCRPGTEKNGALCYPTCKSGYSGVGPVCWERCMNGYTDDGAFCRRDNGFAKKSFISPVQGQAQICPDYPKNPKYPIVLVHGLFGFDKLLGVAPYFNGIPECLRQGSATVFTPAVSAGNSTEVRGEQLLGHVRRILQETGSERVHLIGHSHGGPTARYVAGVAPELVASVTTVGGVNYGSRLADVMLGVLPDGTGAQQLAGKVVDASNYLVSLLSGHALDALPQDVISATRSLSSAGSIEFNKKFPAGLAGAGKSFQSPLGYVEKDGKKYPMLFYSWTGQAPFRSSVGIGPDAMTLMHLTLYGGGKSDGLVGVDAAHFGYFLGAYDHDHLDEVNLWLSGNFSLLAGKAHAVTLFAEHARRLKEAETSLLLPALQKGR